MKQTPANKFTQTSLSMQSFAGSSETTKVITICGLYFGLCFCFHELIKASQDRNVAFEFDCDTFRSKLNISQPVPTGV